MAYLPTSLDSQEPHPPRALRKAVPWKGALVYSASAFWERPGAPHTHGDFPPAQTSPFSFCGWSGHFPCI